MAHELTIEIGKNYLIHGDIFKLVDISGEYFVLSPLKVNNAYYTSEDGFVTMKAMIFADAVILEEA